MTQYIEFKRLPFQDEVKAIAEILAHHGIDYKIESTKPSVDITFSNGAIIDYIIKVNSTQLEEASKLLEENSNVEFSEEGHYLDDYSDEELIEIISLPKEWSQYDLDYAKKLIEQRGISIDESKVKESKDKVLEEQREPAKASLSLIFIGYLLSISFGWLGLLVAIRLKYKTKVINGDEKAPYYTAKDRWHGQNMLLIFFFWIMVCIAYLIL